MKVKIKGGVKGVLLEHGEKAVFGIGVLCFLLFTYGLLGRETLPTDKEPARLGEAVDQAKDFMEHQSWDAKREGLAVVNYISRAKRDDVAASNFALLVPLDQPLRDMKRKRTDPTLLAALDLRTAAGVGAFALKSETAAPAAAAPPPPGPKPPGKKRPRAGASEDLDAPAAPPSQKPVAGDVGDLKCQHWVVVCALVPIKKQFAEYEQTFKDTIPIMEGGVLTGPNKDAEKLRDTPVYSRAIIERAEIVDENDAQVVWQPVNLKGYVRFKKQWAHISPEIVGGDYLDPVYTMPLGPLVANEWDDSVGHEPEIPLAAKEELDRNALAAKQSKPEEDDANGGLNGFNDPGGAPAKAPARPAQTPKRAEKKIVEYRLFRFFDFDVEPGKSYRYRVKLAVKNPNHNLPDKYLKVVDSKKDEVRETPWSQPSPSATVPFGNFMTVATVQPARGNKDATIKVRLTTIDPDSGLPAVMEEDVTRGTVLNFVKSVEVKMPDGKESMTRDNVKFETNAVVLDIRGGQPLSTKDKNLTAVGEALIINADGKLVAHNELDDLDLNESNPTPAADAEKAGVKKNKKDDSKLLDGAQAPKKHKRKRRST